MKDEVDPLPVVIVDPRNKGEKGDKGNQGNRGAKGEVGSVGEQGNVGEEGPPADVEELAGLAMSIKELAQAATSLAQSNERMANNFIDYAQSNARRIRVVVAALIIVIIGVGTTLYGVKIIHQAQSSNASVITAIHNATDPHSQISKASKAQTVAEINQAVECIENHLDRVSAVNHQLLLPARMAGCPVDSLP